MSGYRAGTAFVDIVPSLRGVAKAMTPAFKEAGGEAARVFVESQRAAASGAATQLGKDLAEQLGGGLRKSVPRLRAEADQAAAAVKAAAEKSAAAADALRGAREAEAQAAERASRASDAYARVVSLVGETAARSSREHAEHQAAVKGAAEAYRAADEAAGVAERALLEHERAATRAERASRDLERALEQESSEAGQTASAHRTLRERIADLIRPTRTVDDAMRDAARGTDQLGTESRRLADVVDHTTDRLDNANRRVNSWIKAGIGFFAASQLAQELKESIGGAAELEQSIGGVESVFKEYASGLLEVSRTADLRLGLSENAVNEIATLLGSQLKNSGTAMEELTGETTRIIERAADLSATFGGTTQEAAEAISSALKGEYNPLEKYGIALRQSAIDAKAAALGYEKVSGTLSQQAQAAAVLELIFEQSTDAQGKFAAEADTAAGQSQRLAAQWENLRSRAAAELLPLLTDLGKTLNSDVIPALKDAWGWIRNNGDTLATVGGAVLGAVSAYRGLIIAQAAAGWIGAMARSQGLLNAALRASVIGIVVTAIAALAGWMVHLFQTNENFRAKVLGTWGAISGFVSGAWEGWIKPAFEGIADFLVNVLAPAARDLWVNWIQPAFSAIADFIVNVLAPAAHDLWVDWIQPAFTQIVDLVSNKLGPIFLKVWEQYISPAFEFLVAAIRDYLAPTVLYLWENVVQPAWSAIAACIEFAWGVIRVVWDLLVGYIQNFLMPIFTAIYELCVKPVWKSIEIAIALSWAAIQVVWEAIAAFIDYVLLPVFRALEFGVTWVWDKISKGISYAWENWIKPAVEAMKGFFEDKLAPGIEKAMDIIKSAWDGLKKVAAAPVNFMIDFVYNKGIRWAFNKVAEFLGAETRLPYVEPIRTRARGGYTPPGWTLVGEEGPELVNFTAPNRVYTAAETARALSLTGAGGREPGTGDAWGWIKDRWNDLTEIADFVWDLLTDPIGKLKALIKDWVSPILNSPIGEVIGATVGKLGSVVGNAIKSLVGLGDGEAASGPASGAGWQWQWNSIRQQFPWANLHSALRPGAVTTTGYRSYHALGRAVDVTPDMRIFNWISARYGKRTKELIFSPAGPRQIHNGRQYYEDDPTIRAMHWDHIHWAYDSGGYLPPGMTHVVNATGRPEPVFTHQQWQILKANLRPHHDPVPREMVLRDADGDFMGRLRAEIRAEIVDAIHQLT